MKREPLPAVSTALPAQQDERAPPSRLAKSGRRPSEPAAGELVPVLGARWALSGRHLAVCLLFGGLFLWLNYLPLEKPRLWLHVHHGLEILQSRALPKVDVAQPLTEGMQVIDTTWLAEAALALAQAWQGPHGVSDLFAVLGLVYLIVLARVFYLQTGRVNLMLLGAALVVLLSGGLYSLAGPEGFGALCLAALLLLVHRIDTSRSDSLSPGPTQRRLAGRTWLHWPLTAILFIAWANLHGSFLLGLAVLVSYALGRAVALGWKEHSLISVVCDRSTQRWVLLAETALLASIVNPYGLDLMLENLRLVGSSQLRMMSGWAPLTLLSPQGLAFLGSLALLMAILRHSRRTVRPVEVLLLMVAGGSVVVERRTLSWYAPLFASALMPHLGDIAARWKLAGPPTVECGWRPHVILSEAKNLRRFETLRYAQGDAVPLGPRHFAVSLICVLVVWCSFAFAPISTAILGGRDRKPEHLFGHQMPLGVAGYLQENPPEGMVYAPTDWADWLVWNKSPQFTAHMTSDVQWVPRSVWSDHQRLGRAGPGWQQITDRCDIRLIIADKDRQQPLCKALMRSVRWQLAFEDEAALVATRLDSQTHRAVRRRNPRRAAALVPIVTIWQVGGSLGSTLAKVEATS